MLVALVLVLAVLFLGGGGWHFASQIHADGLEVHHKGRSYGQEVATVGDGTITVADPADEEPVLDGDAVYGLEWDGGYGQISGDGTGDDEVTRTSRCCGATRRARALPSPPTGTFPDDPEAALGTEVEEVEVDLDLGPLEAWYVPGGSDTWAVLVHGKNGSRTEMFRMMRTTVDSGPPSLAVSYRNDAGIRTRDPSGIHQFGRTEWRDLDAAVRHAEQQGAEDVVLVGASMGGGIIASYLLHRPDAPVAGLVLDAPMLDFGETVSYGAEQEPLLVFGHVPAPPHVDRQARRVGALRRRLVRDGLPRRHLVARRADAGFPRRRGRHRAAAHQRGAPRGPPRPGRARGGGHAAHVGSWNVDPQRYDARLWSFLDAL